jgi:hypothetical protein
MNIELEDVKYDSKNHIIVLKAQKEVHFENMKQAFKQILEMSEVENCKNVLINATKTIKLTSIGNLHTMGVFMSRYALKLMKMRLAFTITDEISNDFRFFDNVLANRMVSTKTFKNLDEAKDWLLNIE